jgi:hypothetical protein
MLGPRPRSNVRKSAVDYSIESTVYKTISVSGSILIENNKSMSSEKSKLLPNAKEDVNTSRGTLFLATLDLPKTN